MPSPKVEVPHAADITGLRARLLAEIANFEGGSHAPLLPASPSALLDALPVAIYAADAAGRITFYNAAAQTLWGRSPTLGETLWCGAWNRFASDGTAIAPEEGALAVTLRTGQAIAPVETTIARPDGTQVPIVSHPTLFHDAAGNVTGAISLMLDLSATRRLEAQREDAVQRYSLVALTAADVVWDFDVRNDTVTWSDALERRFGIALPSRQASQSWWLEQIHPDDRARVGKTVMASIRGSETHHAAEYRFRRGDGSYVHVADRASFIRDDGGKVVRAIGAMVDVSERKRSQEMLALSEQRFRLAASAAGLGIADIDLRAQSIHWSTELRSMFGVADKATASFAAFLALVHPKDHDAAGVSDLDAPRHDPGDGQLRKFRIIRPNDGSVRWIASERHAIRASDGSLARLIITNKDITAEKTAQDQIAWAASHDPLTGLSNRMQFQADLDTALAAATAGKTSASLLLIDLDNFRQINNRLGHPVGDEVLVGFARRLVEAMPTTANVARIGGDEFAVILPAHDASAALSTANNLLRHLAPPLPVGTRNLDLGASIGISSFPQHGRHAAALIQSADLALYSAKDAGRGVAHIFKKSLRAHRESEIAMLSHARAALANHAIEPLYQPQIALASGRIAGFEALLRWRDARDGLHAPASIAHAFDDAELAGMLGDAIAELVCADMRSWLDHDVAFGKIALNASPAEFRRPDYAARLLDRLDRYGVPPSMVELEITETALLDECAGTVLFALDEVRAAGITVALDDFGTGFSSLSHLRHFAVDTIKIDRSFVNGIGQSTSDQAIVEAVLRLGQALGMTTVAEGIETRAQADFLCLHGCTHGQGYLFARPLAASRIPGLCAQGI